MIIISINELIDNIGILLNKPLKYNELVVGGIYFFEIEAFGFGSFEYEVMIKIMSDNQFAVLGNYNLNTKVTVKAILQPRYTTTLLSTFEFYRKSKYGQDFS